MFGRPKIDMTLIQTTSKDTLKRTALFACGGDVKAAKEIYDFFVQDMPNMPDYDIMPPSFMDQAKSTIGSVLGWVDENQDKLVGYWNIIQQMRGGGNITPPSSTSIPPIG
jgi:DNA gyrase/topoisomerase IV subunit B